MELYFLVYVLWFGFLVDGLFVWGVFLVEYLLVVWGIVFSERKV
jgi:hypothetical protein